ncbi:Adenylate kinase isoenzyme 5, partial [Orchesella cincta]
TTLTSSDLDPDGRFIPANAIEEQDENAINSINQGNHSEKMEMVDPPRVPIVFVLGGPGSGKITHCDRLVQERPGTVHINMTDLIQQHIVGNGMNENGNGLQDFGQITSASLIQMLQMEMKLASSSMNVKSGFIISGYPRSMRDVVEYERKVNRVDRVILLNWHLKILEKQIEYGSQLGDTVLQLARMELKNYSKHVLPVAEYFDQLKKLAVVDGERQPPEVYQDFLKQVDTALNDPKGGEAPFRPPQQNDKLIRNAPIPVPSMPVKAPIKSKTEMEEGVGVKSSPNRLMVIWVIGGPGSNKSLLSSTYSQLNQKLSTNVICSWLSIGRELRGLFSLPDGETGFNMDKVDHAKAKLLQGDLAPLDIVIEIIKRRIEELTLLTQHEKGQQNVLIIDGFPRSLQELKSFEEKFPSPKLLVRPPPCVLIDCTEVELGRSLGQRSVKLQGLNDPLHKDLFSQQVIKKQLEIYRTVTLPTLKVLDDQERLTIIDGDIEDKSQIVQDFNLVMNTLITSKSKLHVTNDKNVRKPSTDTLKGMYLEIDNQ